MRKPIALLLCTVSLAACSGPSDAPSSAASAPPPPGEIVVVNHGLDVPPQDESTVLAPAALKPDETTLAVAPAPATAGAPEPLTPAVAPAAGADAVSADRIAQLEKEVAALRADYNAMMPAFNGLITTNERIQSLLVQLEQKAGVTPTAPAKAAPAVKAAPAETPTTPVASLQATPATGDSVVSALRIGEHADKTRIVLDASGATEYRTDLNNAEKTLFVTMPAAGWAGKNSADGLKSPLIAGWTAQPGADGKGIVLAVRLKKAAKIVATEGLKAEGTAPARIVLDIAADMPST